MVVAELLNRQYHITNRLTIVKLVVYLFTYHQRSSSDSDPADVLFS